MRKEILSELKKIMVVDDDVDFAGILSDYFKSIGYDSRAANNLEDAVHIFHALKPKVVILDFNMPIVNGDKFLGILLEVNPEVRVIAVTGAGSEAEEKFRKKGCFAFFDKGGLSLEKVRGKVEEALGVS